MSSKKVIAIIGAGISGLATAWHLHQRFGNHIELHIFDRASRPGGWIQTISQQNFLFELGPRSCRPQGHGAATLRLIHELGLQNQIIEGAPSAQKRYLWHKNALHCVPTNPLFIIRSPLMKGIWKELWHEWRLPRQDWEDPTIHEFFEQRFGPHLAARFVDPMVSGIFAGDPRKLSLKACFPDVYQWEQNSQSVIRGAFHAKKEKGSLFTLREGMESLPKTLAKKLAEHIHLNNGVTRLISKGGQTQLILEDGKEICADHVVATLPAHSLAQLVEENLITSLLHCIKTESISVVNLGWNQQVLDKDGFGYLIPSSEKEEILGCVWDSSAFPQQNTHTEQTRLTVMMKVCHEDPILVATRALKKHLNIHAQPDVVLNHTFSKAIPQYEVGHLSLISSIKENFSRFFPNVSLLGNSYHGVAVNDCIWHAECFAKNLERAYS